MKSVRSLDLQKIRSQLAKKYLSSDDDIVLLEQVDSTNNWALSRCQLSAELPKACFAEQQSQGRGRKNRQWYSPQSRNIYMSLARCFDLEPVKISGLGLVIGLGIVRVLNESGIRAGLKWPNDVYTSSGKIAGVLVETKIKPGSALCAVIGVGVNYDMGDQSEIKINTPWTDLMTELSGKQAIDRSVLAGRLLNEIMLVCDQFERLGFAGLHDEWSSHDLCRGKLLDIYEDDQVYLAQYLGVSLEGALMVKVDGAEKRFYAADVSIRIKQ